MHVRPRRARRRRSSPSGSGSTGVPALAAVHERHGGGRTSTPRSSRPDCPAVPMLVLTADRRRSCAASAPADHRPDRPVRRAVRWFHDPGVADDAERSRWRALARDAWMARGVERRSGAPQPAVPRAAPRPGGRTARADGRGRTPIRRRRRARPPRYRDAPSMPSAGVIVAGGRSGVAASAVAALAPRHRMAGARRPVSGCDPLAGMSSSADSRCSATPGFADDHRPDVVVRLGDRRRRRCSPSGCAPAGAPVVQVGGPGVDRPRPATWRPLVLDRPTVRLGGALGGHGATGWPSLVEAPTRRPIATIEARSLGEAELTEPGVARTLADRARRPMPSSSSPRRCRCATSSGTAARPARGRTPTGAPTGSTASMSTAIGVARRPARPTVVLLGDVAFVPRRRRAHGPAPARTSTCAIVVVDNDGGGIFSFLPQATHARRRPVRAAVRHAARHRPRRRSPPPTALDRTATTATNSAAELARTGSVGRRVRVGPRRQRRRPRRASTPPSPPPSTLRR